MVTEAVPAAATVTVIGGGVAAVNYTVAAGKIAVEHAGIDVAAVFVVVAE